MAGKGKRPREQSCKGGSGVTPPPSEKRTSRAIRKRKNTIQTSLSEWVTDDDPTHSQPTRVFTPPLSQIPISQSNMLSPILSQPIERNSSPVNITPNSPISNALNQAASAAFLKKKFVMCEQIMNEKHRFLVHMLDGMNNKVSSIAEKTSFTRKYSAGFRGIRKHTDSNSTKYLSSRQ